MTPICNSPSQLGTRHTRLALFSEHCAVHMGGTRQHLHTGCTVCTQLTEIDDAQPCNADVRGHVPGSNSIQAA